MRLFEGLAQGGGFLAVAASEIGELGSQGAYNAGGKVLTGEGGGSGLLPGRRRGAVVLDPGADRGVVVEEVQGDPGFSELGRYARNCLVCAYLWPPASLMALMTR